MKWFILFSLFMCRATWAEYRVYQYIIKQQNRPIDKSEMSIITSTLDPQSWRAYHGISANHQIDLVNTWHCPGFTGDESPFCLAPNEMSPTTGEKNESRK